MVRAPTNVAEEASPLTRATGVADKGEMRILTLARSWVALGAVVVSWLVMVQGGCGSSTSATPSVAPTCAGVCHCLAAACPDYPFSHVYVYDCLGPPHEHLV